ncbi:hypothetical protein HK102_005844 [Quaeritorhiza haematococci]|nr:hypothetical protein HK102_005844 [Quaeritorhiza haematococci]
MAKVGSSGGNDASFSEAVVRFGKENWKTILATSAVLAVGAVGIWVVTSQKPAAKAPKPKKHSKPKKVQPESEARFWGFTHEGVAAKSPTEATVEGYPSHLFPAELDALPKEQRKELAKEAKTLGNKFYGQKKFRDAIKLYTQAIKIHADAVYFSNRAACFSNLGEYDEVVRDCSEALRMDPLYVKALNRRAQAYERKDQLVEALHDYTAMCLLEEFKIPATIESTDRILKALGTQKAAEVMKSKESKLPSETFITAYMESFRQTSTHIRTILEMAEHQRGDAELKQAFRYISEKKYQKAYEACEKAISTNDCSSKFEPLAYNLRGTFYFLKADIGNAVTDFSKSLDLDPKNVNSIIKMASIFMEKGEVEQTFAEFKKAESVNAEDPDLYYHRGQVKFLTGDLAGAADDYRKSLVLDDDFVYAHIQLGVAQYKMGDIGDATVTFRKASKKFKDRAEVYNYHGEILLDQQKFQDALQNFDKAIEMQPDSPLPYINKALLYLQWKNDPETAENLLRKATEVDSMCDIAYAQLAQLLVAQNKMEEALATYDKAVLAARTEPEVTTAISCREAAAAQLHVAKNTSKYKLSTLIDHIRMMADSSSGGGSLGVQQVEDEQRTRPRKVIGDWRLTKTLGQGSMGKVKLAINITTGEKRACKIIARPPEAPDTPSPVVIGPSTSLFTVESPGQANSRRTDDTKETRIIREAAILLLLQHPNIVTLYEVVLWEKFYYFFFELADGGQMLDYIISHGKLKEKTARKFVRQILSAVDYCHQNSVVHRDLKIENVLIDKSGAIKLIDFGLSNLYSPTSQLSTFCGSLYFAAPELLNARSYVGPEVDVWSLGVIIYVLVCGKVPFDDTNMVVLHSKIKNGNVEYPSHLSNECRHLISRMLVTDPSRRATIGEVKNHAWITKGFEGQPPDNHVPIRAPLAEVNMEVVHHMKGFNFGSEEQIVGQLERYIKKTSIKSDSKARALTPPPQSPVVSIYFLVKEKLERTADANHLVDGSSVHFSSPDSTTRREKRREDFISEPPAAYSTHSSSPIRRFSSAPSRPRASSVGASFMPSELYDGSTRASAHSLFGGNAHSESASSPAASSGESPPAGNFMSAAVRKITEALGPHRQKSQPQHSPAAGDQELEDDRAARTAQNDRVGFTNLTRASSSPHRSRQHGNSQRRKDQKHLSVPLSSWGSADLGTASGRSDASQENEKINNTSNAQKIRNRLSLSNVGIKYGSITLASGKRQRSRSPNSRHNLAEQQQDSNPSSPSFSRDRSMSIGTITLRPGRADEYVRSVFLKNLFSVVNTSTKSASAIRDDLVRVLLLNNITSHEYYGAFDCEYDPVAHQMNAEQAGTGKEGRGEGSDNVFKSYVGLLGKLQSKLPRGRNQNTDSDVSSDGEDMEVEILDGRPPRPSTSRSRSFFSGKKNTIRFEVFIVKIPWLGLHGVQFRRISGDIWQRSLYYSTSLMMGLMGPSSAARDYELEEEEELLAEVELEDEDVLEPLWRWSTPMQERTKNEPRRTKALIVGVSKEANLFLDNAFPNKTLAGLVILPSISLSKMCGEVGKIYEVGDATLLVTFGSLTPTPKLAYEVACFIFDSLQETFSTEDESVLRRLSTSSDEGCKIETLHTPSVATGLAAAILSHRERQGLKGTAFFCVNPSLDGSPERTFDLFNFALHYVHGVSDK